MIELHGPVHLVGIGGMHMSAIAQLLIERGVAVSGSDLRASAFTERLAALGASVTIGPHEAANVGAAALVVTTAAAAEDNPELVEARRRGIPAVLRAEMVARLMEGKRVIAVAGAHGKTTTSSLIAFILSEAGLNPMYLLGGESINLGGHAAWGSGDLCVVEADEYRRAFHEYTPAVAVVTNVEADHLDYYGTEAAYHEAFAEFARRIVEGGRLIACWDDAGARALSEEVEDGPVSIESYGIEGARFWQATDIDPGAAGATFTLRRGGAALGRISAPLAAGHFIRNVTAAAAACIGLGVPFETVRAAVARFEGARRRFEMIGEVEGVILMDDYAHHPTEVRATLAAARQRFPGKRLIGVYQPHTYSRISYLWDEWTRCWDGLDALIVLETYAARETPIAGRSAKDLAAAIANPPAVYAADFDEAARKAVALARPGDVIFTIGAGDVVEVGPRILELLPMTELETFAARIAGLGELRRNEPMSRHTTFGVGGPADLFLTVRDAAALKAASRAAAEDGVDAFALGSGSNILVSDLGIRGLVVDNRARAESADRDGFVYEVESGASFAAFARRMGRLGRAGLAWAVGIPGTLGGAVVYNAGAYGGCLADVLQRVRLDGDGIDDAWVDAGELGLVYRGSVFTRGQFARRTVLAVELRLAEGDPAELAARAAAHDTRRLAAQPRGRNAGSMFKNPPETPAWKLIDSVGLRGAQRGAAAISDRHCNFFVNLKDARAEDVRWLVEESERRVFEQHGIQLQREVAFVGEWP